MIVSRKHRFGQFKAIWVGLGLFLFLWLTAVPHAQASTFTSHTYNGRTYKLFIPSGYSAGTAVPLVVMLHGCSQTPDNIANETELNTYAEAQTFIAVYPQQTSANNNLQCWNWFEPAHQSRGSGEPASIAGITNQVKSQYSVDPDQVYVAGFSAGAAMTVIMGATYPDIYSGIAVGAGLEYKAATSSINAWSAMSSGGPNPNTQGNAAYSAMGSNADLVRVIVFHGTSDYTVQSVNGNQVISQWAQTNDRASDGSDNNNIDDTAEQTINDAIPGGRSFTRSIYEDSSGNVVMEKYLITGMGHAWSGGPSGGSYTDPQGPEATELMLDFFMGSPGGGDTTPPITTASPAGGSYTSAINVTLSVNESATTYYTTDGSTPTTSSAQYSGPINIASTTTLKFFSVDTASNAEAIKTETYTISSGGDTTPPVTSASPAGGSYSSAVNVTLSVNESATTYYTTDGSTPTTSSTPYSGPINIASTTTLKFFSVDTASNAEAVKTEAYTISSGTPTTVSFNSIGSEDGYTGKTSIEGANAYIHQIGDRGSLTSDAYRAILSFDTSSIPDGATIQSATLRIYRLSLTGSVSSITVDINTGALSGSSSVQLADYGAAVSASNVATLSVPTTLNGYSEASLSPAGLSAVNVNGRTQFRLRTTTTANYFMDNLTIYGGENSTYAPVLTITYTE